LTIKFTHEQQISSSDLKSQISDLKFRVENRSTLEKLSVTYLVLYCACTVKLALCVSLLSDITPSDISDLKFQI